MHPNRRWRTSQGGAEPHVPTRPGCITPPIRFLFIAPQFRIGRTDRPRLAATLLPFSLPSAGAAIRLRKPGHRTFTYEVTRHARRTRRSHRRCAALSRSVRVDCRVGDWSFSFQFMDVELRLDDLADSTRCRKCGEEVDS